MSYSFREHFERLRRGGARDARPHGPPRRAVAPEALEVIPDDLVDAMLDGEIDPAVRADTLELITSDEQAHARFESTRRMLKELKRADRSEGSPDFSGVILARLSAERGLFSRFGLRRVAAYRYAAAAGLLLAIAGLYAAQRIAPERMTFTAHPAPIAGVAHGVQQVPGETADVLAGMRSVVSSLQRIMRIMPRAAPADLQRIASRERVSRCDWVPSMNPRVANALWVDCEPQPSGCGAAPCTARDAYACDPTILRALGGDLAAPRADQDQDVVLVRFGR